MSTYVLRYFDPTDHEGPTEPTWTMSAGTEKVTEFYGHGPDGDSVMDAADELLRQCGEEPGHWRGCGGEWEVDTTGEHKPDDTPVGRVAWEIFLDQQSELRPVPTRWQLIAYWRNTDRDVYYKRARRYLSVAETARD